MKTETSPTKTCHENQDIPRSFNSRDGIVYEFSRLN